MKTLLIAALIAAPSGTVDVDEARLWETVRTAGGPLQDAAGLTLLDRLKERGQRSSPEALELLGLILADGEGPPAFWDARAFLWRSGGQWELEADDLRALITQHPAGELADRARKRLPEALRRAGLLEDALVADDALLRTMDVPPEAVLARKADTLFQLDLVAACRDVLEELDRRYPGRLQQDRHLAWIRASIIDRTGTRTEAAAALLHFANRFPAAPERVQALYRTAGADRARGAVDGARFLYRQVIELDPRGESGLAARLDLAALGNDITDPGSEPGTLYREVVSRSIDPDQVDAAVSRLVALEVEQHGSVAAMGMLGDLIEKEDGLAELIVRDHAGALLTTLLGDAAERGADAEILPLYELGLRAGVIDAVPEPLVAAVAAAFHGLGLPRECLRVVEYLPWSDEQIRLQGALCRTELGLSPEDDADPGALARQARWRDLARWAGDPPPRERTVHAARAAFHEGDLARVDALLSDVADLDAAALELLGDARSILGNRAGALEAYRRAEESDSSPWMTLRVLVLERSSGKPPDPEVLSALRRSDDEIVAREAARYATGGHP